jgi:hypothetical protein
MSTYEPVLHIALDEMIAGTLDARMWAATCVAFVVGLLVRGPDFTKRFERRIEPLVQLMQHMRTPDDWADNNSFARMFEQQRLRTPIFCARWLLLETSGRYRQITNDLGYTPFRDMHTGEYGIAIPVGTRHILNLTPRMKRVIALGRDGRWWPTIERGFVHDDNHLQFLHATAAYGRRFIIGPDETTLSRHLTREPPVPYALEPDELGFLSGEAAAKVEMAFLNIFDQLSLPPKSDGAAMILDMRGETLSIVGSSGTQVFSTR